MKTTKEILEILNSEGCNPFKNGTEAQQLSLVLKIATLGKTGDWYAIHIAQSNMTLKVCRNTGEVVEQSKPGQPVYSSVQSEWL